MPCTLKPPWRCSNRQTDYYDFLGQLILSSSNNFPLRFTTSQPSSTTVLAREPPPPYLLLNCARHYDLMTTTPVNKKRRKKCHCEGNQLYHHGQTKNYTPKTNDPLTDTRYDTVDLPLQCPIQVTTTFHESVQVNISQHIRTATVTTAISVQHVHSPFIM